ncbi:MAG: hypothetical protein Q9195_000661 [Heterodermia aff. obscurata]
MAWPNPFRRRNEHTRYRWGYTFQLTEDHLTQEETHPLKYSYDILGEKALEKLDALSPSSHSLVSRKVPLLEETPNEKQPASPEASKENKTVMVAKRDLYVLLRDNAQTDPVLDELWSEANAVPSIMRLAQTRPDYYDVGQYGVPINDLDCIATIGTFSATLIWLSLPRQGIFVTKQEAADYIHLWRYVAYLMGTPSSFFETPEKAKSIMEILLLHEVNPSDTSRVLANNVIQCLMAQPPSYASKSFLEVNSRWLNGNELCDSLGLGRPGVYYWCLMGDRRKIKALRKIFWAVIIESKGGLGAETTFDFKYVPDFSKMTQMEDPEESGLKHPGVERRNLQAFIIGCGFLAVCGYVGLRVTGSLFSTMRNWVM